MIINIFFQLYWGWMIKIQSILGVLCNVYICVKLWNYYHNKIISIFITSQSYHWLLCLRTLEVYSLRAVPRALYEWGRSRCNEVSEGLWCGPSLSGGVLGVWGAGVCRAHIPQSWVQAGLHWQWSWRPKRGVCRAAMQPESWVQTRGELPQNQCSEKGWLQGPRQVEGWRRAWAQGSGKSSRGSSPGDGSAVGSVSPSPESAAVGYLSALSGRSPLWNLH